MGLIPFAPHLPFYHPPLSPHPIWLGCWEEPLKTVTVSNAHKPEAYTAEEVNERNGGRRIGRQKKKPVTCAGAGHLVC